MDLLVGAAEQVQRGGTSACTSGARLIRRNLDVELSFGLITTPDGEVAALWRSAATATNAT
jgi:hypothetical protein